MFKATKPNKLVAGFLALVLIISLGFSLYRGFERHKVDSDYKMVQALVNYDDIRVMSNLSGEPLVEVAKKFKAAGATGVLVKERTLQVGVLGAQNALVLSQDVAIMTGLDLKKDAALKNQLGLAELIIPKNTYFWIEDGVLRASVLAHIKAKTGYGDLLTYQGMELIDAGPVDGNLLTMGVGYPIESLKEIAKSGLTISPQVKKWPKESDESVKFVVDDILSLPNLNGVYFNDDEVPMYDHPEMTRLAQAQTIGFIEFFSSEQKGMETLIRKTYNGSNFNMLRLHAIGSSQMVALTTSRNLEQFKLAVAERGIRAVLVTFPLSGDIDKDIDDSVTFIETLTGALKNDQHQMSAEHKIYNLPIASTLYIWVVGLAAVVGTVMLGYVLNQYKLGLIVAGLGLIGWTGLLFVAPSLTKQLMAIYGCTLFPVIGITWALKQESRTLLGAVYAFLGTSVISLFGAAIQVGLLTENAYVMGIDIFRGVKIVLVAPIFLILLAVLLRWEKFEIEKIKAFLLKPVNVISLVALGILAVAVFVYVRRSGNTGTVSDLEILIRQTLDQILGVRPRTKEFMVGHPALLLVLFMGYKRKWLPLVALGAIGQASMVNTFSHFHTPISVSLIRTFHGVWIGLLIGIVGVLLIKAVTKWLPKHWVKEQHNG